MNKNDVADSNEEIDLACIHNLLVSQVYASLKIIPGYDEGFFYICRVPGELTLIPVRFLTNRQVRELSSKHNLPGMKLLRL